MNDSEDEYTVGQLAGLAHVSVRTLHHYDDIGLLSPSSRTVAGYRLYSADDLSRLRDILFYRELGLRLDDIAAILADPGGGADERLREQHRMLRRRIERDRQLLGAIEHEMEARSMGMSLTPEQQFEVFGNDNVGEYYDKAEQRWGDTDAWRESARRSAAYTKDDWIAIKAEADANIDAFAEAMRSGAPPASETAMALAEEHRQHISRWFYDCSLRMHAGLAEMYVGDPRFTATYDEIQPGMSHYVRDSILANLSRSTE